MIKFISVLFLSLFVVVGMHASLPSNVKVPQKHPRFYVQDLADVYTDAEEMTLHNKIRAYKDATTTEFAVLTLSSLEGVSPTDMALAVFDSWGIGNKQYDNGVLILLAPNDHKWFVQTGYGVEQYLPDIFINKVVNTEEMKSMLKSSKYASWTDAVFGVLSGRLGTMPFSQMRDQWAETQAAQAVLAEEAAKRRAAQDEIDRKASAERFKNFGIGFLVFLVIGAVIAAIILKKRKEERLRREAELKRQAVASAKLTIESLKAKANEMVPVFAALEPTDLMRREFESIRSSVLGVHPGDGEEALSNVQTSMDHFRKLELSRDRAQNRVSCKKAALAALNAPDPTPSWIEKAKVASVAARMLASQFSAAHCKKYGPVVPDLLAEIASQQGKRNTILSKLKTLYSEGKYEDAATFVKMLGDIATHADLLNGGPAKMQSTLSTAPASCQRSKDEIAKTLVKAKGLMFRTNTTETNSNLVSGVSASNIEVLRSIRLDIEDSAVAGKNEIDKMEHLAAVLTKAQALENKVTSEIRAYKDEQDRIRRKKEREEQEERERRNRSSSSSIGGGFGGFSGGGSRSNFGGGRTGGGGSGGSW